MADINVKQSDSIMATPTLKWNARDRKACKKKNLSWLRAEKSIPRDHCLASLGKAYRCQTVTLGRNFLSTPHIHERFLYSVINIHVIWHDFVGTYRYWAPKYESRPTDRNSRYIWIPIFRFCQKLRLVFRSPQTLALSKFTTESGKSNFTGFPQQVSLCIDWEV